MRHFHSFSGILGMHSETAGCNSGCCGQLVLGPCLGKFCAIHGVGELPHCHMEAPSRFGDLRFLEDFCYCCDV